MLTLTWYKLANLWDEISKHGPSTPMDFYDPRVDEVAKELGITKEQAFVQLKSNYFTDERSKRDHFIKNYGWSVPTQEAVEELKVFVGNETVLEVGSGYGLWAKLMRDAGINVVATDLPFKRDRDPHRPVKKRFTDVEEMNSEVATQKYMYQPYVLMMSWPPYSDPMAARAIAHFKGNKLIFIGEGEGGCTGDDEFFNVLNAKWNPVKEINIPQWEGLHDYISLYNKK